MATHTRAVSRQSRQRIVGFGLVWLSAVVLLAVTASLATAQDAGQAQPAQQPQQEQYQELPVDPTWTENNSRKERDARRQITQMLRDESGAFLNDNAQKTLFLTYYGRYLKASMTQLDKLDQLTDLRETLLKDIRMARNPSVRGGLIQLALRMGGDFVQGNYHPAVRANGAFLVGQIDQQDYTRDTLAQPLQAARPLLFNWYRDAQLPEAVRAAALMGLVRHSLLNGPYLQPADDKVKIASIMLGLLKEQPPAGREPRAHAWLQRTAIDVLIKLGYGDQPQVYEAVAALAADKNAADIIRVHAAGALGRLPKPENFNGEADKQAAAWASLLAASFEDAAARIQKQLAPKPQATGGYGEGYGEEMMEGYGEGYGEEMMEGYGGGYGAPVVVEKKFEPQPKLITVLRERLNYRMEQKHLGIDGQALGAANEVKSGLLTWSGDAAGGIPGKLREAIAQAQGRVNDRTVYELEPFMELLNEQATMLKQVAAMGGAAEVEPLEVQPLENPAAPTRPEPEVARAGGQNAPAPAGS